ncbi:GGDEF domain-containing protein [Methylobacterium sp. Leaf87]|uniref:GGDEF domain-containing protein n=1 Tax=Methylobacterium sp. Leaf87 TaxID=1736243 RepID=UPI0009E8B4C3|nr:GGDEF domain-containing protein [Methylobacterium sp. Leaf87]
MLQSEIDANRFRPWYRLSLPPDLEARFRAGDDGGSGTYIRSWLLVFILFNILSLKLDYEVFGPDAFAVPAFLTLGVFTPVACLAILSLKDRPSPLRRTVAATVTSLLDMAIVLNGARTVPDGHADVYMVLAVIVPLVVGLIAALSFRHSLVFCGLSFALYLGWVVALHEGDLAGNGLPLLVASLILVPIKVSFSRERQEKQAFLLRLSVEAQAAELTQANARLKVLSEIDALTGLANRRVFDATLAAAWDRAEDWCCVVAIDIDRFKDLNDTAGHPEGDRCLAAIAAALDGPTRAAGGLLARYGGEEFTAFVPACTPEDALDFGERLRAAVETIGFRYRKNGRDRTVTVSVGITAAHGATRACGVRPSGLLKVADLALYDAKSRGRNRVEARPVLPDAANRDAGPRDGISGAYSDAGSGAYSAAFS